mgnify:CR=1 FL=1
MGLFTVNMGLFTVNMGLFTVNMGLFTVNIGLFTVNINRCYKTNNKFNWSRLLMVCVKKEIFIIIDILSSKYIYCKYIPKTKAFDAILQ